MPRTTPRLLGLATLGILLALPLLPAAAAAQDPPPPPPAGGAAKPDEKAPPDKAPPDKNPPDKTPPDKAPPDKAAEEKLVEEIKAYIKQYEELLPKMTDADAIAGIAKFKAWYMDPKVADPEKKSILQVFSTKIVRQKKDAYLESAAKALGDMGGEDSATLLKGLVEYGYGVKGFVAVVVKAGLGGFGKIASIKPGDTKWLSDQLKGREGQEEFIPEVARAMAGYARAPGAVRRDLFEELLKRAEGVYAKLAKNDNNAKKSWNIWGTDVVDAMKALTRKNFEKPPEYRTWFNDKSDTGGKNPKSWPDAPPPPPPAAPGGK